MKMSGVYAILHSLHGISTSLSYFIFINHIVRNVDLLIPLPMYSKNIPRVPTLCQALPNTLKMHRQGPCARGMYRFHLLFIHFLV